MGLLPEILFLLVIIISWIELSHFCSTFHQAQSIESGEFHVLFYGLLLSLILLCSLHKATKHIMIEYNNNGVAFCYLLVFVLDWMGTTCMIYTCN